MCEIPTDKEEVIKLVKEIEIQANEFFSTFPDQKDGLFKSLLVKINKLIEELGIK